MTPRPLFPIPQPDLDTPALGLAAKNLTPRQLEILALSADGLTDQQIADKLSMKLGSVRAAITIARNRSVASDPIVMQRVRLIRKLPKSGRVIEKALDCALDDEATAQHVQTGAKVALDLNRGLGVLREVMDINNRVDIFAQMRRSTALTIELSRQFGINKELPELINNTGELATGIEGKED